MIPRRPRPATSSSEFLRALRHHLRFVALGVALLFALAIGAAPTSTFAHAAYERSQPAANAILPTAPSQLHIWFTEPLEASSSGATVVDQSGETVTGITTRVAESDDYQLVVSLPAELPNGTYTVAWFNVSTADGHPKTGYFAFTIGTAADVSEAVVVAANDDGPPEWLRALSRWLAILALAAAVAIWPTWVFVLRPAFAATPDTGERAAVRAQWLVIVALLAALATNLFALLVQAAGGTDANLLDSAWTTVTDTRYGRFWLLRIVLLAGYATALSWAAWWPRPGRDLGGIAALVLAALLPFPNSMISHAAAQTTGRATAIAFDYIHLLGAAVWIGGLIVMATILLPALRAAPLDQRRPLLASAIPRFSAIALAAWTALAVTGLYNAWLQVGSIKALTDTDYGHSLIAKLALLLPLLALGAINLLVIGPGAKKASPEPTAAAGRWSKRFTATVVAEVALATVVLLVVGRLIGQEPGRETLASAPPDKVSVSLDLATRDEARPSTFTVTPGQAGPNDYLLDVGGSDLPEGTEAVVRPDLPNADLGGMEIALQPAGPNRFTGSGSELAIAGDWTAEVIIRKLGALEGRTTVTIPIAGLGASADDPASPAWKFDWPGTLGLIFFVAGLMALVAAWFVGRSPNRFRAALFGSSAIFLGAILLLGARIPATEATLGGRTPAEPVAASLATPVSQGDLTVTLTAGDLAVGANALEVSVADAGGVPVADATVSVESQAVDMDMGMSFVPAAAIAPGRYLAEGVPLGMIGEWRIIVTVERPGQQPTTIPFLIEIAA